MFPGICLRNLSIPLSIAQLKAPTESRESSGLDSVWQRCPEDTIIALQSKAGAEEVVTVDSSPKIGQPVQLIEGPFEGLEVVVTQLLPAKRTDPSAARVSWAVAGDGSSCGKVLPT
jgi:transcription antitermination factor NusG